MLEKIGERSRRAAQRLALMSTEKKTAKLYAIAEALRKQREVILAANTQDVAAARETLSDAMIDRLTLTAERFDAMVAGVEHVATLPDPVGELLEKRTLESGLELEKRRVPLGVVAIIYESRPNVTVDAGVLCFKSGNAVILRGGKEALHTNCALADAMASIVGDAIQLIRETDHALVTELVQMEGVVDVVIPRGGERLIRAVVEQARVPVLKHYKGVCHIYVAASADIPQALDIIENAKCQRPGVCNAMESLLVDQEIAEKFLPQLVKRMQEHEVEIIGCPSDWSTEYLAMKFALKVVPHVDAAIDHINRYGSHHSDAILTQDAEEGRYFQAAVDSAVVYVNASTRFTDGGCFGLGAEIGISTDKLHARGPMGLAELCSYKYFVTGTGQIR